MSDQLSARAKRILYHAVSEYVSTGEPVGSRTLAKKGGIDLSPASIRNVLADLEDAGYLAQPHTSAGRIPTDRAFRLFIDALMEVRALSTEDDERIRARFESLSVSLPASSVMRETGKLLSEMSGTVAVVVPPRMQVLTLRRLRFIRTSAQEVLAVLVLQDGGVQNRFLRAEVTEDELVKVHNFLDDIIEGRSLGELKELFERRLSSERVKHDEVKLQAFSLGEAAVADVPGGEASLVIEGQERLFGMPEFSDPSGVQQLVFALDSREKLIKLFDELISASGVAVGSETGELGGGQLSIVGASYTSNGRPAGTVGVIGPTRMDYPKVVPLVRATAEAMSEFMSRSRARDDDDA